MVITIQDVQVAALQGIAILKKQLAEALVQGADLSSALAFELTQNAADAAKVQAAENAAEDAKLVADAATAAAAAAEAACQELKATEVAEDAEAQEKFQEAIDSIALALAPEEPQEAV